MFVCLPLVCLIAAHTRVICVAMLTGLFTLCHQNCLAFCAIGHFKMYDFFHVIPVTEENQFLGDFNMAFNFQWQSKITCYLLGALIACCLLIYQDFEHHRLTRVVKLMFSHLIVCGTLAYGAYHFLDPLQHRYNDY